VSRKREKDKQGYQVIGIIAFLLIGFFVFRATRPADVRCSDGCCGPIPVSSVILLDHTDATTQQTKEEIVSRALAHIDTLPEKARISVFAINEQSKANLKPLFSRCVLPRDGNQLISDPKQIRKAYEDQFRKPLEKSLREDIPKSDQTPLAQVITDISLSRYVDAPLNHLLVFSDMLEHTSTFSLYSCTSSSRAIVDFRKSRRGAQERPRFLNTDFVINLVPRFNLPDGALRCRDGFWNWFFGDNRGPQPALRVDYLPGGDPR
jgi:hypothetical protein